MTMKKIFYFFAATLVLAAVGCSKDDAASNDAKYVSEIKIGFEGDTRVSASHSAAGLKFAWEDGDIIEVYEDQNKSVSRKLFVYDAAAGCFMPQGGYNFNKLEVGKKYFAVNSLTYWESGDNEESVIELTLKGGAGLKNIPMITDVFEATAENTMATMHHTVGVVEIPVKAAAAIAKLQLLGLNSQTANLALRGQFTISPKAPYTLVKRTYGYFDSYNQTATATPIELSTTETTSIFIPALPGNYSTIDIKYTLVGGSEKTINTNHSLTVERGKITKVSEMVLGNIVEE